MTNNAIILANMEILVSQGIITWNNEIHTWARWHSLGYKVKHGEHAIAKFPIWKYKEGKKKDAEEMTEEEAQKKGYCFMKNSAWFSDQQVEPI